MNYKTQYYYTEAGRRALIEQVTSHKWEGWFEDTHAQDIYEAKTKKELLEDMGCVYPYNPTK